MPKTFRPARLFLPILLRPALVCVLALTLGAARAQPAPAAVQVDPKLHARLVKLYSFRPHQMNADQVAAKEKELAAFWGQAKNENIALALLRAELKDARTPPYFAFDGGKLLMSMSRMPEDQALALQALPRVDLRDVDGAEYVLAVHWFARNGFDSTRAALHMLDYPSFTAEKVAKDMDLSLAYSLIFGVFPMPEARYVPALAARLRTEKNVTAQRALLLALWYSATPEGTRALDEYAAGRNKPEAGLQYARQLLAEKVPEGVPPGQGTVDDLRDGRRESLRKIDGTALRSLDRYTAQIYLQLGKPGN